MVFVSFLEKKTTFFTPSSQIHIIMFSKSFIVLHVTFRSKIYLEFTFMLAERVVLFQ